MSGALEESDYWEMSRVEAFNFDDENDMIHTTLDISQPFSQLAMRVRADIPDQIDLKDTYFTLSSSNLPLNSIIDEQALQCILQLQSSQSNNYCINSGSNKLNNYLDMYQGQAPNDLPQSVLFQRHLVIENFKSLKNKITILDAAIQFGDGDSVLMTILWMQKTVNKKIFQDVLRIRPIAMQNYISYLTDRNQCGALTDLLVMLGKTNEAVAQQFQLIVAQPIETRLKKLSMLYTSHCKQFNTCPFFTSCILKYNSILDSQKNSLIHCSTISLGLTIMQVLYWLCVNHWSEYDTGNKLDPKLFAKDHKVASMQYDWTVILARSMKQDWNTLRILYIKTGFLKKRQLSTSIPIDKLILQLHKLDAPSDLLEELLNFLSEPKKTIVTRAVNVI